MLTPASRSLLAWPPCDVVRCLASRCREGITRSRSSTRLRLCFSPDVSYNLRNISMHVYQNQGYDATQCGAPAAFTKNGMEATNL